MLTIFIDALSSKVVNELVETRELDLDRFHCMRLIHGMGYSSNLHWQMFAGKSPDASGFFSDWGVDADNWRSCETNDVSRLAKLLDKNSLFNAIYRVVKRKLGMIDENIPLVEKDYFHKCGSYLFSDVREAACQLGGDVHVIKSNSIKDSFSDATKSLGEGCKDIFIVIDELDHIGHEVGGSGQSYKLFAKNTVNRSLKFAERYSLVFPDEQILIVSDHGMVDIKASLNILDPLYLQFGLPGKDYLVFNDSVYLRLWFRKSNLKERMIEFLSDIEALRLLTCEERSGFEVSNEGFGDLIYVLNKGYVFSPNNFSLWVRGMPKGMHGYIDTDDDACGVVIANRVAGQPKQISVKDIHKTFYL